jgi:hypothetical protein
MDDVLCTQGIYREYVEAGRCIYEVWKKNSIDNVDEP